MAPLQRICQDLARLPTELANEIVSDLKLWDVVKLLWYDDPRVDAVVSSHRQCRHLLGEDDDTFSQTLQTLRAYLGVYAKAALPFEPAHDVYNDWQIDRALSQRIDEHQRAGTINELNGPIQSFLHRQTSSMDLEPYVDLRVPVYACNTVQALEECMDAVLNAKRTLFRQISDQLDWAAALMERNPDILKRTLDPEQKRRPNTAHIQALHRTE